MSRVGMTKPGPGPSAANQPAGLATELSLPRPLCWRAQLGGCPFPKQVTCMPSAQAQLTPTSVEVSYKTPWGQAGSAHGLTRLEGS